MVIGHLIIRLLVHPPSHPLAHPMHPPSYHLSCSLDILITSTRHLDCLPNSTSYPEYLSVSGKPVAQMASQWQCAFSISDHLTNLFNYSFASGAVRAAWDVSRVTPIPKTGD